MCINWESLVHGLAPRPSVHPFTLMYCQLPFSHARIAQLVTRIVSICILRIAGSSPTDGGCGVLFRYGPSHSQLLAWLRNTTEINGGSTQWIARVKITQRLSKIQLSLLIKNGQILGG